MMLRFIPYTVVGGFLAGSGILILQDAWILFPSCQGPPQSSEATRALLRLQPYRGFRV